MKKILTEKNLMWVAIGALVTLQLFPGLSGEGGGGVGKIRRALAKILGGWGPQWKEGKGACRTGKQARNAALQKPR